MKNLISGRTLEYCQAMQDPVQASAPVQVSYHNSGSELGIHPTGGVLPGFRYACCPLYHQLALPEPVNQIEPKLGASDRAD
jgi:hypothetical protein